MRNNGYILYKNYLFCCFQSEHVDLLQLLLDAEADASNNTTSSLAMTEDHADKDTAATNGYTPPSTPTSTVKYRLSTEVY